MRYPKMYLVDNPKGLSMKWISYDLKRLYDMKFLDREREKRPILGLGGPNRGFQYRYWVNNTGLGYALNLKHSGFRLPVKPSFSEVDIFAAIETQVGVPEADKPAKRQQMRINLGLVHQPLDPGLPDWMKHQVLERGDRLYRKWVGISRRYGQRRTIANLTNQVANLTNQIQELQAKLTYVTACYQKCRSELKTYDD